ncbi:ORF54 [Plodia interpunctella granulovirus]|uniref:ORF54 n=1 Tax=Plodia interpunctella granulovirus TaxID=262175 RepID=A0A1L5JH50_9BBAC|nr:ORF54 [Plodia interpunctella granulovirus]APO13938.1 ORF54 [Plodia interpunctella granulovirus]
MVVFRCIVLFIMLFHRIKKGRVLRHTSPSILSRNYSMKKSRNDFFLDHDTLSIVSKKSLVQQNLSIALFLILGRYLQDDLRRKVLCFSDFYDRSVDNMVERCIIGALREGNLNLYVDLKSTRATSKASASLSTAFNRLVNRLDKLVVNKNGFLACLYFDASEEGLFMPNLVLLLNQLLKTDDSVDFSWFLKLCYRLYHLDKSSFSSDMNYVLRRFGSDAAFGPFRNSLSMLVRAPLLSRIETMTVPDPRYQFTTDDNVCIHKLLSRTLDSAFERFDHNFIKFYNDQYSYSVYYVGPEPRVMYCKKVVGRFLFFLTRDGSLEEGLQRRLLDIATAHRIDLNRFHTLTPKLCAERLTWWWLDLMYRPDSKTVQALCKKYDKI